MTDFVRDDWDDLDGWMKRKEGKWPRFHSTFDIIRAAEEAKLPDRVSDCLSRCVLGNRGLGSSFRNDMW
jgi:hypothetical protein